MEKLMTVQEWVAKNCPYYVWSVTEHYKSTAEIMNAFMKKADLHHSYTRYGYPLAEKLADIFCNTVFKKAGFGNMGFCGRFYNSGMSAIVTAIEAAGLCSGDQVIAGKILYPETTKHLDSLKRYGIKVDYVDSADFSAIESLLSADTKLVFMETVGNGWGMPVVDWREIFNLVWDKEVTFILDNTFLSCALCNPFESYGLLAENSTPKFRFVYLESGTKYYRAGYEDEVTFGIMLAPDGFIEEADKAMSRLGTYLQQRDLMVLPINMWEAVSRIIGPATEKARELVRYLRTKSDVLEVSYPDLEWGGPVIYIKVKGKDEAGMVKFVNELRFPQTGSFGHPRTTVLPIFISPDFDSDLIRISVGWKENLGLTVISFKMVFGEMQYL